jgi:hypothetical protein
VGDSGCAAVISGACSRASSSRSSSPKHAEGYLKR